MFVRSKEQIGVTGRTAALTLGEKEKRQSQLPGAEATRARP